MKAFVYMDYTVGIQEAMHNLFSQRVETYKRGGMAKILGCTAINVDYKMAGYKKGKNGKTTKRLITVTDLEKIAIHEKKTFPEILNDLIVVMKSIAILKKEAKASVALSRQPPAR